MTAIDVIHTQIYSSPVGQLCLAEHDGRLCMCDWLASPKHQCNLKRLTSRIGSPLVEAECPTIQAAYKQLNHFFAGKSLNLHIPLKLVGTPFQVLIWKTLMTIPPENTITYSDLANAAGCPTSIRAVANAVACNPLSIFVPCHRVVGRANPAAYAGGAEAKKYLLSK